MPWVCVDYEGYLEGGQFKTRIVYLDFEGNWMDSDKRRARVFLKEEDTPVEYHRHQWVSDVEATLIQYWQSKEQTRYMAQSLYGVSEDTPDGVLADLLEEDGLDQASLLLRGSS